MPLFLCQPYKHPTPDHSWMWPHGTPVPAEGTCFKQLKTYKIFFPLITSLILTAFDPGTITFKYFYNYNDLLMTKWSHVCFYLHVPCFPRSLEDLWMLIFLYKEIEKKSASICLSICSFFFNNHFPQKSELHSCSLREYNSAPCKKGIVFAFWIFLFLGILS